MLFFYCYYFPLFNLFATFGIYFSASKRWRKQSDKADAEKIRLTDGEEDFLRLTRGGTPALARLEQPITFAGK